MRVIARMAWLLSVLGTMACDPVPAQEPEGPTATASSPTPLPTESASAAPSTEPTASATPSATTSTPPAKPPAAPPAAADAAKFAKACNTLGFELFGKTKGSSNFAISPASISLAMAMTWAGAKGETAEQMKKVLHFEGTPSEVSDVAGKLTRWLQDDSRAVKLRIANQLFGEKTFKFEQPFVDSTQKAYGASLEPVDYRGDPEAARVRINGWVETQTEKRIVDLIPKGALTKDTRLTLVNAIYFLGDWQDPFDKDDTQDADFSVTKAKKVKVPMMNAKKHFNFGDKGGTKVLELPYKNAVTQMLLVLPKDIDGLPALEKSMKPEKVDELIKTLSDKKVEASLPKFEVNPSESLALADTLKSLGMKLPFEKTADFTLMANPPSPDDRLYIQSVFHKAFVKVDEKGTEAAAATAVAMARVTSAPIPEKAETFKADHPFLFIIRDRQSGLILFMGRVVDPSTK